MRVYLFRLSLSERGSPDLFTMKAERPTRTEFLQGHFSRDRSFDGHGGAQLRYAHSQVDGNIISGVIAKWVTEHKEADPSNIWASIEQKHWEKAAVFLNLDPHEQVIGVEYRASVGKPSSIIKYLINEINEESGTLDYQIDIFPVTLESEFWHVVREFKGPVTSIKFDLVTPNPTDSAGATSRALKRLRKRLNADRYKGEVSNKDGLEVNDPLIEDVAQYASSGGGDILAKSGDEMVYNSREHVASAEISDEARPSGEPVKGLQEMLMGRLKR